MKTNYQIAEVQSDHLHFEDWMAFGGNPTDASNYPYNPHNPSEGSYGFDPQWTGDNQSPIIKDELIALTNGSNPETIEIDKLSGEVDFVIIALDNLNYNRGGLAKIKYKIDDGSWVESVILNNDDGRVYHNDVIPYLYCSGDCGDTDAYDDIEPTTGMSYVRYFITNNVTDPTAGASGFQGHFDTDDYFGECTLTVEVEDFQGNTTQESWTINISDSSVMEDK